MIDGYVITLSDNPISWHSSDRLIASSEKVENEFTIHKTQAITPDRVTTLMKQHRLHWNYPWQGSQLDLQSGLTKSAYQTVDPNKRIACFLSHYLLWKKCVSEKKDIMIFEHDAYFTSKLEYSLLFQSPYDIIGLNDPMGATRRAQLYHEGVSKRRGVSPAPKIDDEQIPQGIAGNSAYFIKPEGAQKLINLVDEYGAWPNDAIMCKQLIPRKLGQLFPYVTKVQGIESTTSI